MSCQVSPPRPVQARSKARREALLDAAAVEFEEQGFSGASLEAVARAADSSIGALYRFFPDKGALFEALAERCLERSEAFFAATVTEALLARPWRETLTETLRGYMAFYRADRSFRAVWRNLTWAESYLKADVALRRRYGERVAGLLRRYQPRLEPARARRMGLLIVELTTAVCMVDPRSSPLFEELTLALVRYLEAELDHEPPRPSKGERRRARAARTKAR